MRRVQLSLPLLLLMLSLSGIVLDGHASVMGLTGPMPIVHHPLVYRYVTPLTGGNPPYEPSDVQRAYDFLPLYAHGVFGNGTHIAIVDAFGDPNIGKDLSSFDSMTGLSGTTLHLYWPDGVPTTTNSGWAIETALDVEWAHSIAPGASIDIVIGFDDTLPSVFDAIKFVSTSLTGETALSMSFGLSESQYPTTGPYTLAAHHQLFATIASHGTAIFASSGDNGATVCCDPSYPASDPLVVAVGGTTLNLDANSNYAGEDTWSGSGAGSSVTFAKPSWQHGNGDSMRDITDVSYDADPNTGVLVVEGGRSFQVGGTSAGSPQWAALSALANQATNIRFGAMNSRLYNLTGYHDITTLADGFFAAGTGWDYPTGLGTPDASLLISNMILPKTPVRTSSILQGINATTTGSLQVNIFNSTASGTALVLGTNSTTGVLVYMKSYNLTNIRLQNMTSTQSTAHFLLNLNVNPNPLSVDLTLTIQGNRTQTQGMVTREINISGSGRVSIVDLSLVLLDFNTMIGNPNYNPHADLAATGTVDINDVSIETLFFGSAVFN